MEEWMQRTSLLLSEEMTIRLQSCRVLVVGVGGVGAYAAEMLVRVGVGRMTIIDSDSVALSNINRQLVALHSTVGLDKVDVLANASTISILTLSYRHASVISMLRVWMFCCKRVMISLSMLSIQWPPKWHFWLHVCDKAYLSCRRWEPVRA